MRVQYRLLGGINMIHQGTVRASKKKNALLKLKSQFRGQEVKLTIEKVDTNTYEYLIVEK